MVIAEETAAALRRAGHRAEVLVTPQNRFGRQLSRVPVHVADGRGRDRGRPAGGPGDLLPLPVLRRAPPAARLLAQPPHARVLRPVGALHARAWGARAGSRRACAGGSSTPSTAAADAQRDPPGRAVADDPGAAAALRRASPASCSTRRRRSGPIARTAYGDYVFAVSRLHPAEAAGPAGGGGGAHDGATRCASPSRARAKSRRAARAHRPSWACGPRALLGPIDDAALLDHYARCRAVYFAPVERGLRVRHAGGLPLGQGRDHVPRQRRAGRAGRGWPHRLRRGADPGGAGGAPGLGWRPTAVAERMGEAARQAAAPHTWDRAVSVLTR